MLGRCKNKHLYIICVFCHHLEKITFPINITNGKAVTTPFHRSKNVVPLTCSRGARSKLRLLYELNLFKTFALSSRVACFARTTIYSDPVVSRVIRATLNCPLCQRREAVKQPPHHLSCQLLLAKDENSFLANRWHNMTEWRSGKLLLV